MLKTRLPEAELAPTRCFIHLNARWKRAQPLLVLLHHFVVCEPRVRDKYSFCCSPLGWPRMCGQCSASAVVPGEPDSLTVQPSLCSPGTPAGAPAPLYNPILCV